MRTIRLLAALAALSLSTTPLHAQTDGTCVPIAERAGRKLGCFITARHELGPLRNQPALYWHVERFATLADARRAAARDSRSTAVESLQQHWVFTIAPRGWHSRPGKRIARVGPLPLVAADSFAAVYMEAEFEPGMHSVVHRHDGAEAWFTLEGSQCVETPNGKLDQSASGPGVVVAGGLPMRLTGTGTGLRRSLVLILQDATKPRSTPASDWTPKGLCKSS
jgi:quercetin dioxygenase-like cupin family protein